MAPLKFLEALQGLERSGRLIGTISSFVEIGLDGTEL